MNFGDALFYLKAKHKITRKGWNGHKMWIALQEPDALSLMKKPYIYIKPTDGELVPWTASQTDLLANDWEKF